MIRPFGERRPSVDPTAVVFESAFVIGGVAIGARSSVWFGSVVRGDVDDIAIGERTNVQDRCVIHVTTKRFSTRLGDDVTVGHAVTLHGCTIGNRVLVGIGAIVMDGCEVGDDCMIAAGSLLAPGTKVPAGHLALGSPAAVKRPLRDEECLHLRRSAENYALLAARYRELGIA
ncbi:MAG TPA: gamma carbonic anhydrase family protein [Candidatus Binatia bacterium]|nr:gamma carbonic anhydrase family protein [Candidatus Binatia bacterium]